MNIYVGNLPFSTKEGDLKVLFEQHGEVKSVKIVTDRETGRARGFAFVEMDDEEAKAAIASLNGKDFGGRQIVVNEARPKRQDDRRMRGGPRRPRE